MLETILWNPSHVWLIHWIDFDWNSIIQTNFLSHSHIHTPHTSDAWTKSVCEKTIKLFMNEIQSTLFARFMLHYAQHSNWDGVMQMKWFAHNAREKMNWLTVTTIWLNSRARRIHFNFEAKREFGKVMNFVPRSSHLASITSKEAFRVYWFKCRLFGISLRCSHCLRFVFSNRQSRIRSIE